MTFNPRQFAEMKGSLSEKLAVVFDAIGATADGTATSGDYGRLIGSGSIATARTNTATTTDVPMQIKQSFTLMGSGETGGDAYFSASTGAALAGQLATAMVRTNVLHNIFDAYGLQYHLAFGSGKTVSTTDANAHLTAISGKVTFDTTTVSKGWVNAGLFIIEGDGTCSQMCHGVSIVEEAGSTGAQSMLHLNTDVGTTPYFSFVGADGTGKSIYTHTAPPTITGMIKILVNGAARWIPFASAE